MLERKGRIHVTKMMKNRSAWQVGKRTRLFLMIVGLTFGAVVACGAGPSRGDSTATLSPMQTTLNPNSSSFQCPSAGQVSGWMNISVSQVTKESCAFTAGNNGQQLPGVICTNQDGGTTIEYTPVSQPNTLVVQACDGSQLPDIWGFTIRFGAVCSTIAEQAARTISPGWTVQANC